MMRKVRIKEDVGTQDMRTFVILRVTSDYFSEASSTSKYSL